MIIPPLAGFEEHFVQGAFHFKSIPLSAGFDATALSMKVK
jgi:hypothetical protein